MKRFLAFSLVVFFLALLLPAQAEAPLRIFIRGGVKTHGPGQHDHPRFLGEWTQLLTERGAQVEGGMEFPSAAQLEKADVLIMYAANAGDVSPEQRAYLDRFLQRGGGMVVIHDAVASRTDPHWFKSVIGGAWEYGHSRFFEGDIAFYYTDRDHPISQGAANFDLDDEMYWDLRLMPEARVLAATYTPDQRNTREGKMFPSVYDIAPQMWVYEKDNYRSFVTLLGHNYKTFNLPHVRAVLLRGIAWAGKRDVDSLATAEELSSLGYPEGGPTAPEEAAALIEVHPEFILKLVAAEPLIEKPIAHDWDPRGRLWVAETPEYPAGRLLLDGTVEDRPARDRISILEDTNGDGRMDKKTVFYDGLELVTSFVFYRDGVIVSQAPDIYWLRDTNGDGQADKKEVVFTGFGTRDTHAVISNMRWGLDGWVYATLGYSGADPKSADGSRTFPRLGSGVVRFLPDGSQIEMAASKNGNTWGMDFAWDGELFFSQANGNHINHVILPEPSLARGKIGPTPSFKTIEDHNRVAPIRHYEKQAYVQIDHVGGFTSASGCTIYNGGAWPAKYENTHYVSEPTVNLVHQDILKPNGVTFTASKEREEEFMASTDLWFRPIHARVGPDGALYILDFYNQAVVHNDTRGPRHGPANAAVRPDRDQYFGRIWRVQHKQAIDFESVNLAGAAPRALVRALDHPNEWVRMSAHRLLMENDDNSNIGLLRSVLLSDKKPVPARVHALWIIAKKGGLARPVIEAALNAPQPAIRNNALRAAAGLIPHGGLLEGFRPAGVPRAPSDDPFPAYVLPSLIARLLDDPEPRTRLLAVEALASFPLEPETARALVRLFPALDDPWTRSAVAGVASRNPMMMLDHALDAEDIAGIKDLVSQIASQIAAREKPDYAATTLNMAATKPSGSDPLKQVLLEKLTTELKADLTPEWTPQLEQTFRAFLNSRDPGLTRAALPLLARWDKAGVMRTDAEKLIAQLLDQVRTAKPAEQRAEMAASLIGVRQLSPRIIPAIGEMLGGDESLSVQRRIIDALGNSGDAEVGATLVAAFPRLNADLQAGAFAHLIKRPEWTLHLIEKLETGDIAPAGLGPTTVHRLRTHADPAVARRANAVLDALRGPDEKEKSELIARLMGVVAQPGNVENGKEVFVQNCAVCHLFNGEGREVGPDLTGMGAHGAEELLTHILDPNRLVEPNFIAYSIETRDGDIFDGMIARENQAGVVLRNASGEMEIRRTDIATRQSTGLSVMPDGFEALGETGLRDLIAYLSAGDAHFRLLDLKSAFTADSRRGVYNDEASTLETLRFKQFGIVRVEGVPFEIIHPTRTTFGKNLIVLKGGFGFAKTLPQRVEVTDVGVAAAKLHFLGGVGGWGYPWGGNNRHENLPVAKVTVRYRDGQGEEIILRNGVEIADYNSEMDVPGSKRAADLVHRGQVRWFTKTLARRAVIDRIVLESFDNVVAPTFVSITAELPAH